MTGFNTLSLNFRKQLDDSLVILWEHFDEKGFLDNRDTESTVYAYSG